MLYKTHQAQQVKTDYKVQFITWSVMAFSAIRVERLRQILAIFHNSMTFPVEVKLNLADSGGPQGLFLLPLAG